MGEFEEMYRKFDDPWQQISEASNSYIRHAVGMTISKYNIQSIVEVGCGLGYTTNYIKNLAPSVNIEGADVSETAIQKAKERFPNISFMVSSALEVCKRAKQYDAILFAEVMWYILRDIKT